MFVDNFSGIYYLMFLPIALWGGILAWRWVKTPELGHLVYDSNVEKGLLNGNVPRDEFVKSFARAERPRLGVYQCAIAFLALVLLPLMITVFYGFTHDANIWGEDNVRVTVLQYNLGIILGDFLTILLIMGINAGLLAATTFFYYRNRPPSLRAEIRRLEEQYG